MQTNPDMIEDPYPFQALLGFTITGWAPDFCQLHQPVHPDLGNRFGIPHGGVYATLLDTVMAGGSFRTPVFIASWPSGEFGGMGLEGAVRLGYRRELEAVTDPKAKQALYDKMVAAAYERGKALNAASVLEIDTVIDPEETRTWIAAALEAAPAPTPREGKKHGFIDAW